MRDEVISAIDRVVSNAAGPRDTSVVTLYRFKDICDHWATLGIDAGRLKALDSKSRYSQEVELELVGSELYAVTSERSVVTKLLDAGFSVRQVRLDPYDLTEPEPQPVSVVPDVRAVPSSN